MSSFQVNPSAAVPPVPNGLPPATTQYPYGRAVSPMGQAYCSPSFVNHANAYPRGGYNHQYVMANQHSAVGSFPPVPASDIHSTLHMVPGHNSLMTVGVQTIISAGGQNAVEPKTNCHNNNTIETDGGCHTATSSTVSRGSVDKSGVIMSQPDVNQTNKTTPACTMETNVNDESNMNPMDIACSFVYQYYKMVHDNPQELHRFYDADSQMFRGSDSATLEEESTAFGQKEIHLLLKKCFLNGTTSRIRFIQAQECDNGINVLVTGKLKHGIDAAKEFTQSVFLAKQKHPRKGWYVSNDMLTYLEFKDEEVIVESKPNDDTSKTVITQPVEDEPKKEPCETNVQSDSSCENKIVDVPPKECTEIEEEKEVEVEKPQSVQEEEDEEEKDPDNENLKVAENENLKVETEECAPVEKKKKENYWKQNDVNAEEKSSSAWPNLADSTNRVEAPSAESTVNHTIPEIENYAPTSYAGKLFKNLPNSGQPVKMGYAVPGPESNDNTAGRNNPLVQNPEKKWAYRKLWVAELPQEMDDNAIKKAVADQLMNINHGYVIQVDRVKNKTYGYLELDSSDSVEILLERGLFFRGRTVRIDYVRNSRSGGVKNGRLGMSSGYKREEGESRNNHDEWNGLGRRAAGGGGGGGINFRKGLINGEKSDDDAETKGKDTQWGKEHWKSFDNRYRQMNHLHNTMDKRAENEEGWIDTKKKRQFKTNEIEATDKNNVGKRVTNRITGVTVGKKTY